MKSLGLKLGGTVNIFTLYVFDMDAKQEVKKDNDDLTAEVDAGPGEGADKKDGDTDTAAPPLAGLKLLRCLTDLAAGGQGDSAGSGGTFIDESVVEELLLKSGSSPLCETY